MGLMRQIKPNSNVDIFAMIYVLSFIHLVVLYGDFLVAPWMMEVYGTTHFQIFLYNVYGGFLYINVVGNMWKIIMSKSTTVGRILPTLLKPGWHFCHVCEANSPPRSYHCGSCNRCVLKRDHHCMFTGKCIGYFNHRYYLLLVVYAWFAAMFASTYTFAFAWSTLGGFSWGNLLCFIFPIIVFICGILDIYTACVTFLTFLVTLFWMILTLLVIWNIKPVMHNLTTHERRRSIYIYDLGWQENIKHIFGSRWYVAWMFPWIRSQLPGDGIEFPTKENFENPKDI